MLIFLCTRSNSPQSMINQIVAAFSWNSSSFHSLHRFPSRLSAPEAHLKMLHPHFPSPLLRTNLGNTWIQKNTRTAMALALFGLTTAATTKVVCHHSGPERHAFVRIKWLGILAPSAGITSCMLTLGM